MSSPEVKFLQNAGDGVRTALGVGGLIAIVLGLLIIFFPGKSGQLVMQLVAGMMAAYALVVGAVYLGSALFSRTQTGWARTGHIVLGLLYIVGGVLVMANLDSAAGVLAGFVSVVVGLLWIFEGIMALTMLKQSSTKIWTIIFAAISIIAGAVLIGSPLLGAVTLWLLLGISMLLIGVVQLVRAFSLKPKANITA